MIWCETDERNDASLRDLLPRRIEERLKNRKSRSEGNEQDLLKKLEEASEKRSSLLERRSKRARELGDCSAAAEKRHQAQKRVYIEHAAYICRERRAHRMRNQCITHIQNKAANKNIRVKEVKKTMEAKKQEEIQQRQKRLEYRLQKASAIRNWTLKCKTAKKYLNPPQKSQVDDMNAFRLSRASKRIQHAWKDFCASKGSTTKLVNGFVSCMGGLLILNKVSSNIESGKSLKEICNENTQEEQAMLRDFEDLAKLMQKASVIRSVTELLQRFESKLLQGKEELQPKLEQMQDLFQVVMPKSKIQTRYPARIFLSAFMIILHPEVVLNAPNGNVEVLLRRASVKLLECFLTLIKPFIQSKLEVRGSTEHESRSSAFMVQNFDESWLTFLKHFASWKDGDVAILEQHLISMACDMLFSALAKCGPDFTAEHVLRSPDLTAIVNQINQDHALIREKLVILNGEISASKLDSALVKCKEDFEKEYEEKLHLSKPDLDSALLSVSDDNQSTGQFSKEKIVHELVHDPNFEFVPVNQNFLADVANTDKEQVAGQNLKMQSAEISNISHTMEKAFWDIIIEDMEKNKYKRVYMFLQELQEGIGEVCDLSRHPELNPQAKIDILMQNPDGFDFNAFLVTVEDICYSLCYLGAPAREEQAMITFNQLKSKFVSLQEEREKKDMLCTILKYLHTLLHILNADIINSQVRSIASVMHGDVAFDYLKGKFQDRFNLDFEAKVNLKEVLPKTCKWLEKAEVDLDGWNSGDNAEFINCEGSMIPSEMRSGGIVHSDVRKTENAAAWRDMKEISRAHLLLSSCGILSSIMEEEPLSSANLPEILDMDADRLVLLQNSFQRLFVLSTCCLLFDQFVKRKNSKQVEVSKESFIRRINALLLHPSTRIRDVATEICNVISKENANKFLEEETITNLLQKIFSEESAAHKSLKKNLMSSLSLAILRSQSPSLEDEIALRLRKCGASVLKSEVIELSESIQYIAAVTCKIHKDILEHFDT